MINLLPDSVKEDIHYGRRNARIVNWLITLLFGCSVLVAIALVGRMAIATARDQTVLQKQIIEDQLAEADYTEISAEYDAYATSINNVGKLYKNQILYSRLIRKLGTILPTGARITSISIGDKDRAIDINFNNSVDSLGPVIQVNLTDQSKQIFTETAPLLNGKDLARMSSTENTVSYLPESQQVEFFIEGNDEQIKNTTTGLKDSGELAYYSVKAALSSEGYLSNDASPLRITAHSTDTSSKYVSFSLKGPSINEAKQLAERITDYPGSLFIETYTYANDPTEQKQLCGTRPAVECSYTIRAYYDELYSAATLREATTAEKAVCATQGSPCTHHVRATYTQLFSKVDILQVATCGSVSGTLSCSVNIRAEFNPNAKFYLLGGGDAK